ncbi:MAG: response regulator [Lysobacteraceae bacterium]|nr:MAG: response regulator [Xanthomonadaceae bacterium]
MPKADIKRRVLVYAPIGRDGPATADLLRRADMVPEVCEDFEAFLERVESWPDAVFVAEEGLFGKPLDRLAALVAAQEVWSDLPFVVLTSRHDQPRVNAWRQELAQKLGNVALLERPVQSISLVSMIEAALRARLRQLQVRSLLAARDSAASQLESLVAQRTVELEQANSQLRTEMGERARVEASLRHAQKLEALGQLTGGVAHDFNNLLMVITAGLDMLERQHDPARRARMLQGMRQAAQRGASLTRQLLAFSRSHALRPETVDLSRHLRDMREMLDRSLRGDVHVDVQLAPDLWPLEVDPGELELVLLNLAVNARDAMPGGGIITIRGENRPALDKGGLSGDFVCLSVNDTGSGMTDEVKAHVFEPFFTTKEIGKGSGLGLAQVYGFAQQSGGTVDIVSSPGQGTSITLLLPRSHRSVPDAPVAHAAIGTVSPKLSGVVLLVEDDSEVAALVRDMLVDLGYEVVHASSAEAALGALADRRRIDLVFSDIMMAGGTNGVELAREIHKRRSGTPILLTSGYSEPVRDQATELGIQVLPKPYGLDDLRVAIADTLAEAAH